MIVSFWTTCMNLQHSSCTFSMQIRESNGGSNIGHKTQQARLPADPGLYNSTFPSLVNCILTLTIPECRSDHHGSCTSTAWSRQSVCSPYHVRGSYSARVPRSSSAEVHREFVHHILEDEVDGQKEGQTDKREDDEEREGKMESSKREQSDTTTTMRMKHGCDGMSADPNLSQACACNSL